VIATAFLGAVSRITVDLGEAGTVLAQLPTAEAGAYPAGSRARLSVRLDPVLVTPVPTAASQEAPQGDSISGGKPA
jgi:putative spermidine/putrescine transport system ATP-binding protein